MLEPGEVTVVITTRDRLTLLGEAVASVERQSWPAARLVIVDDASTDGTWSWLQQLSSPNARCIRLASHGERSAARNAGLAEVDSPFVLFLDDDDHLSPNALEMFTSSLVQNEDAVAVIAGFEYFDDVGHRSAGRHPGRRMKRSVWTEAVFGWPVHTGRTLYRVRAVREAGGFQDGLVVGEDRDLLLRVSRCGPVVLIPDVLLEHRMHPGQWRPRGVATIEREITRRHLASLPADDRRRGERIAAASDVYDRARVAWAAGRPREAIRIFLRLRRAPRDVLFSPILGLGWSRHFWRALAGFLVGERGVAIIRKTLSRRRKVRPQAKWSVPFPKEIGSENG